MKKQFLLIAFLVTSTFNLMAQKYELGKVTLEELNEKKHPIDSSAAAAIVFRIGEVRFEYAEDTGFDMVTIVKTKIKIYKKEGYDYANFSRSYYVGGNSKESIGFSKAYTYNIVDGKVEKTKLKSDSEFDEKLNSFWNRKKISMPNIKEGSIIEFEYTLRSPTIGVIDDWEFQADIPVGFSEYKTYIPEYFVYNPIFKGYIFPKSEKDSKQRTINYTYTSNSAPGLNTGMPERIKSSIEFTENLTTYSVANLPALKDEKYVNNIKNYLSSVSHELSMTRYPNEPYKTYSTDWESVTKTIYSSEAFGDELNKTGYFEADLKPILDEAKSVEEKVFLIFEYVKSKVNWNGYYGYYCADGVKKAYKNNVGNSAEINLMLTSMLRYANIESNPVLISTRSNGISLFPNRTAYDYVISSVEIGDSVILLDATDRYSIPNLLPIRDLNWNGRIIRKNGSSAEINLMPTGISSDVINLMATVAKDGTVEGKIREQHFDYNALVFRSKFGNTAKENYLEHLEEKRGKIEIGDYDVTGKKELGQPIVENYSFKSTNSVEIIGDKIYFSPLLFLASSENPFKQEKREYPVDFAYPNEDKYIINLTIPEGYAVESMPKSQSVTMSDDLVLFKYLVANTDNKIQVSLKFNINSSIISPEYYEELKAVFNEIVKAENEKVVLKKV